MTTYELPDLPYDYGALAPSISGEIMELHHSKHHATYVAGVNTALEQLADAREKGAFGNVPKLQKDLAFHLSGHVNHSIFWTNLSPDGGGNPTGDLGAAIERDFGSFEGFRGQFSAAATSLQGSGWAFLTYEPAAGQLLVEQRYDQQGMDVTGSVPLLLLDMWEHAFYLQYKNVKADYVKNFWDIINWDDVAERYAEAAR